MPEVPDAQPDALPSQSPASPVRVVVADDESHILNVVSLKLRRAGFEVHPASDGGAALKLCRQVRPAVVVTDFHMPHLDGVGLCRTLRQEGVNVVGLLLTARGNQIDQAELDAAGIAEVLSKPFSPRELAEAVRRNLPELPAGDSGTASKQAA